VFFWLTSSKDTPEQLPSVEPAYAIWPKVSHVQNTVSLLRDIYSKSDAFKNSFYFYNIDLIKSESQDGAHRRLSMCIFTYGIEQTEEKLFGWLKLHKKEELNTSIGNYFTSRKLLPEKPRWIPTCKGVMDLRLSGHLKLASLIFRVNAAAELQDAILLFTGKKNKQLNLDSNWRFLGRFLDSHLLLCMFVDGVGEISEESRLPIYMKEFERKTEEFNQKTRGALEDYLEREEEWYESGVHEETELRYTGVNSATSTTTVLGKCAYAHKLCYQHNVEIAEKRYADDDDAWEEEPTRRSIEDLKDENFGEVVKELERRTEYVYEPADDIFAKNRTEKSLLKYAEDIHCKLRRVFSDLHANLFVDFDETIDHVENNPLLYKEMDDGFFAKQEEYGNRFIMPHRECALYKRVDGKKKIYTKKRIVQSDVFPVEKHSIYHACLFRVNSAVAIQRDWEAGMDDEEAKEVLWLLQRFIGNHLELLLYIVESGATSDEKLQSIVKMNSKQGREQTSSVSPYCRFYPAVDRAVHCGSLPDLTHLLDSILPKRRTCEKHHPILHILKKCLPYCCHIRGLIDVCIKSCKNNKAIIGFFRAIFLCSLNGMYRNVGYRPTVYQMLRNIKFMDFHPQSNFSLIMVGKDKDGFLKKNNKFLYYSVREYLAYLIDFVPSIKEQTDMNPVDWDKNNTSIRKIMDIVRCWSDEHETLEGVNKMMVSAESSIKRSENVGTNRIQKFPFMRCILNILRSEMEKFVLHMYEQRWDKENIPPILEQLEKQLRDGRLFELDPFVTNAISVMQTLIPGDLEGDNIVEKAHKYLKFVYESVSPRYEMFKEMWKPIDQETKNNITKYALSCNPNSDVCFEIMCLPQFGNVDIRSIDSLNKSKQLYDRIESETVIRAEMSSIMLRDSFTILHFVKSVLSARSMKLIPIAREFQKDTENAMRKRRHVVFGDVQDADQAYNVYYTPCCDKITNMHDKNFYGNKEVTFNVFKGRMECSTKKKTSSENTEISRRVKKYGKLSDGDIQGVELDVDMDGSSDEGRKHWLERGDDYLKFRPDLSQTELYKIARNVRKNVEFVECFGTEVTTINIKGFMLEKRSVEKDKSSPTYHLFCPSCACFDEYADENWYGGKYKCRTCWALDYRDRCVIMCEYCGRYEAHSSRSMVEEARLKGLNTRVKRKAPISGRRKKHETKNKNRPFDNAVCDFEQRWIYDDRVDKECNVENLLRKVWMCNNCKKSYLFSSSRIAFGESCAVPRWTSLVKEKSKNRV
jgi:hypothetical protein